MHKYFWFTVYLIRVSSSPHKNGDFKDFLYIYIFLKVSFDPFYKLIFTHNNFGCLITLRIVYLLDKCCKHDWKFCYKIRSEVKRYVKCEGSGGVIEEMHFQVRNISFSPEDAFSSCLILSYFIILLSYCQD